MLLSANGLALLLFGILPQPLMGLCVIALLAVGHRADRGAGAPCGGAGGQAGPC